MRAGVIDLYLAVTLHPRWEYNSDILTWVFTEHIGSGRVKKVQRVKKEHRYLWYLNPGPQCENGFWYRFFSLMKKMVPHDLMRVQITEISLYLFLPAILKCV